jgi:hypothetical protein
MVFRRFASLIPLAVWMLVACSKDEPSATTTSDAGGLPNETSDAGGEHPDLDASTGDDADAESAVDLCAAASKDLASTADAQAPELNGAASNLQRVASNDNFCATQKSGAHPTFGAYGYLLNVFLHDADGDGPTLDELSTPPGVVRFGSFPGFTVTDKFDIAHGFSTQGEGFVLQLCLDQAYAPGTVTIALDVADKAGHRSKAICVKEFQGD